MIRKVYLDIIWRRLSEKHLRWFWKRGLQYLLTHASFLLRRPLCGPVLGTLVTNYHCNYRCRMCDLPLRDEELRASGGRELSTDELKRVLRGFATLGTPGIGFTGGEPLLRHDLFELLACAHSLGMITHLNTNGSLVDEIIARKILAAGVDSINLSLDGATASTHDRIRGVAGAYARVLRAAEILLNCRQKEQQRLRIKAVGVIDELNIDEVPAMVELGQSLGMDCMEFIPRQRFRTVRGEDPGKPAAEFLDKVEALERYLLEDAPHRIRIENSPAHIRLFRPSFRGEWSPLACYAGYNSLAVDCYGDIYPCVPWVNWRKPAGNLFGRELKIAWQDPVYDAIRAEVRSCRKCYLNCQTELNLLFRPTNSALTNSRRTTRLK